jgi:hypothetical protein
MGNAAANNANAGTGTLLNYGNNASNLAMNAGNATAAGYVNQSNAWNSALNGVGSAFGQAATGMARYGNYGTNYPNQYAMPGMYGRSQ